MLSPFQAPLHLLDSLYLFGEAQTPVVPLMIGANGHGLIEKCYRLNMELAKHASEALAQICAYIVSNPLVLY